tara:strand:- start:1211 stop:2221 length:1011 start_codon:yes stop_codon:yes gene_type:complete
MLDFLYTVFILGAVYNILDLAGKINVGEISSMEDFNIFCLKKYVSVLNAYYKAKDNYDNTMKYLLGEGVNMEDVKYSSDTRDEDNMCFYKIDIHNDSIYKLLYTFERGFLSDSEGESEYHTESEYENDSNSEYEPDFESESDDNSEDVGEIEKDNEDNEVEDNENNEVSSKEINNALLQSTISFEELEEIQKQENNDKNKYITFAYDNKTDTYLELNITNVNVDAEKMVHFLDTGFDSTIFNKNLFINVELQIDGNEFEITRYVSKYYRENNRIFSKKFMEYLIIDNGLSIEINDKPYKIMLMDSKINMVEINENQHIDLTTDENSNLVYTVSNTE